MVFRVCMVKPWEVSSTKLMPGLRQLAVECSANRWTYVQVYRGWNNVHLYSRITVLSIVCATCLDKSLHDIVYPHLPRCCDVFLETRAQLIFITLYFVFCDSYIAVQNKLPQLKYNDTLCWWSWWWSGFFSDYKRVITKSELGGEGRHEETCKCASIGVILNIILVVMPE